MTYITCRQRAMPMRAHVEKEGLDMPGTTPAQFVIFLNKQAQAWEKTIKDDTWVAFSPCGGKNFV